MRIALFIITALISICPSSVAEEKFAPELYAFFNGMPKLPFEKEAEFLKETGYAGISQIYANGTGRKLAERVAAYEKAGVKVLSVYLPATANPIEEEAVKALANRGGMIELTVKTVGPEVIASIRKTATMAEKLKIKVALYPHAGLAVETVPQAMDLIGKVDHPNLGVMFNLCHFLKSEKADDLEKVLAKAGDRLFAVSICGADTDGKGWGQLIQTLDKGTFPQKRLFNALKEMNFKGPVGLQCYALKGDRKTNLATSMKAWQELLKKLNFGE
ncbi:MAG: TIM barrel protein [Akkermansiaceae bacterium]|nr:TIM barrel protein [Akkermansiaceae bacterium]